MAFFDAEGFLISCISVLPSRFCRSIGLQFSRQAGLEGDPRRVRIAGGKPAPVSVTNGEASLMLTRTLHITRRSIPWLGLLAFMATVVARLDEDPLPRHQSQRVGARR
jgi:hypothetical protein